MQEIADPKGMAFVDAEGKDGVGGCCQGALRALPHSSSDFFFFPLLCITCEVFFPGGIYSIWYRLSDWKNGMAECSF